MTPTDGFAAGYLAGYEDMRRLAARCCQFDVYNIGNVTRSRIDELPALRPVVNAAGEVLLIAREANPDATGPPPPDGERRFHVEFYRPVVAGYGLSCVTWRAAELDVRFRDWRAVAVTHVGWPPLGPAPERPSSDPTPVPPVNRSEAPEPHEGFKAKTPAKVWAIMWAAGYDLPNPEKFPGGPPPHGDWCVTKVIGGPFKGRNVSVCERAGPWTVCALGNGDEDPVGGYVAVRLCDLRAYADVYDERGNLKCPIPRSETNTAAPSGAGGGNPEMHPCA